MLPPNQVSDPLTLLALQVRGEPLALDHGYPGPPDRTEPARRAADEMGRRDPGGGGVKTVRIVLVAAGVAMMTFAVVGALTSPDITLSRHLIFLVGALLLHDALLGPVFIAVGVLVHRTVRPPYRAIVQGALIATAAVTFVALPFMLGYGRIADNPSALPRNYVGGYAIVVGAIWLGAAALIARRELRKRPRTPTSNKINFAYWYGRRRELPAAQTGTSWPWRRTLPAAPPMPSMIAATCPAMCQLRIVSAARITINTLDANAVTSRPRGPLSVRPSAAPPPARSSCQLADAMNAAATKTTSCEPLPDTPAARCPSTSAAK